MGDDKKTVTIYVEAKPHEWPKNESISFEQVVRLEVPGYTPQSNITYSVKWTKGNGNKPEGVLVPGASVKVKDGIRFTVSETGQS
ncbi:multiubiquitin domain-containing protein [uncultured Ramlibacter sp.]|uniref:multiubiquitin domain-containing protein n=1 Tax=uncultured Ramlibacter sp. TaxID=260755 RepID=UPI00263841AA|nr:multiubiquitin domain-containing protein [uncultured Ramlibacter sp.]